MSDLIASNQYPTMTSHGRRFFVLWTHLTSTSRSPLQDICPNSSQTSRFSAVLSQPPPTILRRSSIQRSELVRRVSHTAFANTLSPLQDTSALMAIRHRSYRDPSIEMTCPPPLQLYYSTGYVVYLRSFLILSFGETPSIARYIALWVTLSLWTSPFFRVHVCTMNPLTRS